jgi:hypothetical protein
MPGNTIELSFLWISSLRRRRDDVGDRDGVRIDPGGDEPCNVRHVDEEVRADRIGDAPEARPVDHPGVRREARDDELRPMLGGEALDLVVVDLAGIRLHAVLHRLEQLPGEVHLRAVREVPTVIEAHAEDRVARRQQREIHRLVRLRPRVRLHVRERGAEQRLRALDRQPFGDVDELATAVVALARVAFGVLVGEHRALCREDPRTRVVLRRDQLDMIFLALPLVGQRAREFVVESLDRHLRMEHAQVSGK